MEHSENLPGVILHTIKAASAYGGVSGNDGSRGDGRSTRTKKIKVILVYSLSDNGFFFKKKVTMLLCLYLL